VDVVAPQNQAPHADFSSQCGGLTCQFTDASSDPDGQVTGWSWSFGDGSTSSSDRNPSHTFAGAGTYTVTLTATDNGGASNAVSAQVKVTAPPPNKAPQAEFDVQCTGLTCAFTDKSKDDDGTIAGWHWDFGDGQTSPDQNPSHSYGTAGRYHVTLTVTDNQGAPDSKTHDANPTAPPNQPPAAEFTWSCSNLDCTFTDGSSDSDGTIAGWSWNFDDGTGSTGQNPSHSYPAGKTYHVKLTVTDNDGSEKSVQHDVTVTAPPNQAPTATPDSYTMFRSQSLNLQTDGSNGLLSNDHDPENDNMAVDSHTEPSHGTLVLNDNGTFTYTVTDDAATSDGFTYAVKDENGAVGNSTDVTITINP
jgi:VCBS repeat-containing protein